MTNTNTYYYAEAEKKLFQYLNITDLLRKQRKLKRIPNSKVEDALSDLLTYLTYNHTISHPELIEICKKHFN
jgi:hypothetical protein